MVNLVKKSSLLQQLRTGPDFFFARAAIFGLAMYGLVIVGGTAFTAAYVNALGTATTDSWPFDTSANYAYDSGAIEVTGSVARLVSVDQTDDDGSADGFGGGAAVNTQWDPGNSWFELDATGQSAGAGDYTSRAIDVGDTVSWTTITWAPERPLYKELPDNDGIESGYSNGNADMSVSVLLYHLNEAAGSTTVTDTSGNANNASCSNCPVFGSAGQLNTATDFDGTNDYILIANTADINTNSSPITDRTIELWFYADDTTGQTMLYEEGGGTRGFNIYIDNGTLYVGGWNRAEYNWPGTYLSTPVSTGSWNHVALKLEGADGSVQADKFFGYLNGVEFAHGNGGHMYGHSGDIRLGSSGNSYVHTGSIGSGYYFDGKIDEVAIYNRGLSATEVADHYKRGALRLKHQVRSCDDAVCDTETFLGPDGTSGTYYSELNNATLNPPSQPLTGIANNRYLQYKSYLETDDSALSPELKAVTFGPAHYPAGSPGIVNSSPIPNFSELTSFSDTLGSGSAGNVTYQLSNNGSNWYYHDGVQWSVATGPADSNSSSAVSANTASFDDDVGAGAFFFNALLNSDGTQQVELDQVDLGYNMSEIQVMQPDGTAAWEIGSTHTVTWQYDAGLGSTVNIYADNGDGSGYDHQVTASTPIGAGGSGSYSWVDLPESEYGTGVKLRVCSNAYPAICGESGMFHVVNDYTISSPNGGETYGALSEQEITWSSTGTSSNVNLSYSLNSGGEWNAIDGCTNTDNDGSCAWTVPNVDDLHTALVKIEDANDVLGADSSDSDFHIDYYDVEWSVLDKDTGEQLTDVTVTDTSGWSEAALSPPVTHSYPYGTYSTIWTKYAYTSARDELWTFDDPSALSISRTVELEPIATTVVPDDIYEVLANFTYTPDNDTLNINAWLQVNSQLVTEYADEDSAVVELFQGDTAVAALTAENAEENGSFLFEWKEAGLDPGALLFAVVKITRGGMTYESGASYAIALKEAVPVTIIKKTVVRSGEEEEAPLVVDLLPESAKPSLVEDVVAGVKDIREALEQVNDDLTAVYTQFSREQLTAAYTISTSNAIGKNLQELLALMGELKISEQQVSFRIPDDAATQEIFNEITRMRAVTELAITFLDRNALIPVSKIFYTRGSVVVNILTVNPASSEQEIVPVSAYLPEEITPEDIADLNGFELAYDAAANTYYIEDDLSIAPGDTVLNQVELNDVWYVDTELLDSYREQADAYLASLKGTTYYEEGRTLRNNVNERATLIVGRQEASEYDAQQHMTDHRQNREDLMRIERDLDTLRTRTFQASVSQGIFGDIRNTIYFAIGLIAVGFVIIIVVLVIMWYRQPADIKKRKKGKKK